MTPKLVFTLQGIALLTLAACAPLPDRSNSASELSLAEPVHLADLEIDEVFGKFALLQTIEFPDLSLGVNLRFLGDLTADQYVDVYVYPVYLPDMLSLGNALEFEQMQLDLSIDEAWDLPEDSSSALIRAYQPKGLGPGAFGLLSARPVSRNGQDYETFSFLMIRDDSYLKIRKSVEIDNGFSVNDFELLIDQVTQAVRLRAGARTRADYKLVVTASTVVHAAAGEPCVLGAWMMYGIKLISLLQDQRYLNTLDREVELKQTMIDYWIESRNNPERSTCESDYLSQLNRVAKAGFLKEHVFEAYGRPYWALTDDLRVRDYLLWARDALDADLPARESGLLVRWK